MAVPLKPLPVKYIVALLFRDSTVAAAVADALTTAWGKIDFKGDDHQFDVTDYYENEMGTPLYRRILAFEALMAPTELVPMKLACNALEEHFAAPDGKRMVNLDAGYLDHNKYLLASAKEAGQKIYLDHGIYADLSGRYRAGKYQPFEWSFPDFRDGRYDAELLAIRQRYLLQVKSFRI